MAEQKTVFITGVTGLVGSYLAKVFLEDGHRVYALVRSNAKESASQRVLSVLKFWDENVVNKYSGNLYVLEGDITQEKLGLDNQAIDLLKREVDEIFHCAAATQLNLSLEKIRKINVEGTKNILDLGLEFKNNDRFKKVSHVSTIFIYGDYEGIFDETKLDVGQKISNPYSQSKFEAEKLIYEYRKKSLWIDIFRPAIIIGESTTGKVISFDRAFYQAIRSWNLELFSNYPGKGNYLLMTTFVDELCRCMLRISMESKLLNKIYHCFGQEGILLKELIDFSSLFLRFNKPMLVSTSDFLKSNPTLAQRKILEYNFSFNETNVSMDSKLTNQIFEESNCKFSKLTKSSLSNLLNYSTKMRFLRKK